jgi:hypothetical protein
MSRSMPKDLQNQVLHWWKILDNPTILKDDLVYFLAFDLFIGSIEYVKKTIEDAVHQGFLCEDPVREEIQLNTELSSKFLQWQEGGIGKVRKMDTILRIPWRDPRKIESDQIYQVLISELVDPIIRRKAEQIRSSSISFTQTDFAHLITGTVNDLPAEKSLERYKFSINPVEKSINHGCNEFRNLRQKQKRFCPHLARVFMKLFVQDKEKTIELLRNIVEQRDSWSFNLY